MGHGLPGTSEGASVRHRFHSICPYFAMFPETFVEKHLAASPYGGVVFDPFCGRGTTVFQALLQDRDAAGNDLNPVAVCISGAKCDPPERSAARARVEELRREYHLADGLPVESPNGEFFELCFHRDTLGQIRYLRSVLDWRHRKDDRFIAALCLGALHGESHRSPNCFSNRMPRTISTKPDYSVRWWRRNGYTPPSRDVFEILLRMIDYRFRTPPPETAGRVVQADARLSGQVFPALLGRVTDVITSPPYLDTTNYREDQWLRLWFLGHEPRVPHDRTDDRHYNKEMYWEFLEAAWKGVASLLADQARLVVRIGGRRLNKAELRDGLVRSLAGGLNRTVCLIDTGVTSKVRNTQANSFRGARATQLAEHDFCFTVEA